jgi:hypothetical protein
LFAAREAFAQAKLAFPCTLWTVGTPRRARACFVGLMPTPEQGSDAEPEARALLERELVPHLRGLRRTRVDFSEVQRELIARAELAPTDAAARKLAEALHGMA